MADSKMESKNFSFQNPSLVDKKQDQVKQNQILDETKEIAQQRNLRNLVVPWGSLAMFAVAMTMYTVLSEESLSSSINSFKSNSPRSLLPAITTNHKPLYPLSTRDYIGFFCATLGLIIAGGGGIGGGGILVPIYILVLGFTPKHAIPLANVTVFGGACANTILNTRKRHPLADRPLVDWDLILVMEPLTIAGALIGAFLNKLLPERLLVVMLVILLSFTAYNTLTKATKMYKKETKEIMRQQIQEESVLTEMVRLENNQEEEEAAETLMDNMEIAQDETPPGENEDDANADKEFIDEATTEQVRTLQKILDEERVTPMNNIWILVSMFVVVLFINIMKGGGAFPSPLGIKCGSTSFWVANFIILAWIVLISLFVRSYLVNRFHTKERVNYPYAEGDVSERIISTVWIQSRFQISNPFPFFFFSISDQMGRSCNHSLSRCLCIGRIFRWYVWSWWRNRQRSSYACYGNPSCGIFCIFCMHDFVYQFYSHNFLCRFWATYSRLCTLLLHHGFHCDIWRPNRSKCIDEKVPKEFIDCIFYWLCCPFIRIFDDHSKLSKYC